MATMSIRHPWKYDVFVSFRGEDIRKTFVDHLFTYFKQIGFRAFRDDRELPKGEEISPHLYKAIEESRFLIVIFSKNYASSSWCLRELVKILECKQMGERKHEVRIIFYDVKPHVVRHQTESYAEAFKNLKRPEVEVEEWRKALSMVIDEWEKSLSKAANLSGWDLQDTTNGFEAEFIIKISNEILEMLLDLPLHVGENLVGVDILLDKLNLSRFVVSNDKVNRIGICGISGIGKTTLAKAIYNLMYDHFEGSCFCENIREERNLAEVQRHMIGKIMKTKIFDISNVSEGAGVLKQRMPCKPVLLVLDDVDDDEQLESLAGSASWFCKGSLIIFTCKDKQLLRSHGVDEIHEMDFLDEDRSLELFRSYAFKEKDYPIEFKRVSQEVVNYVQGHPLALKVLGRFLYGKTVGQWKSELKRLKVHPNEKIQRVLRLSYDGLDRCQQNILLDIACLFIGENSDFVASILDGCNFFAVTNMRVLFDKSLITVSRNNSLQMHGLIQAMAREIVSEESRRLLISSNVYDILSQNEVEITEAVEVLVISLEKFSQKVQIDAKDFALMKKLRILKIYQEEKVYYHTFPLSERKRELEGHDVIFSGENLDYLSNNLSLFYWHGCPFECLPSNFYPINIVAIDLSYSNIKHFWTTPKPFESLKVMKLTFCCNLTTTPDFSEIRNLEELNLEGCVNLVNVHPSIGKLGRLVVLNLRDCKRLQYFPSKQHPRSSVSLAGLRMLKDLNLSYCDLLEVCESIGGLSRLNCLYLQGNKKLEVLPSLGQLSHLQTLVLDGCRKLKVLPELPHSLDSLYASMCTSLREVSGSSKDRFKKRLNRFRHCPKLFENVTVDSEGSISKTQEHSIVLIRGGRVKDSPGVKSHCIRGVKDLLCLDSSVTSQGSIDQLSAFLGYLGFQTNRCEFFTQDTEFNSLNIVYPGNSIPEWFTNRSTENNVEVELPSEWCFNKFWGFGTCVVFKCKDPYKFKGYSVKSFDGEGYFRDLIRDYFPTSIRDYFRDKLTGVQDSYMIWLHYQRYTRKWAEATKSRTFWFEENNEDTRKWEEATESLTFCFEENNEDFEVKEFGVRLICDEDVEHLSMIQNLPTPTQHGGMLSLMGRNIGQTYWSW